MSALDTARILVVDDEPSIRETLTGVLEDEGCYEVAAVSSGEECLDRIATVPTAVVLLDVWLSGIDGLKTLEQIQHVPETRRPVVVMISGHGNIETAVRATKLGAHDFLEKPLSVDRVTLAVRNAADHSRLLAQNATLRSQVEREHPILGGSVPMKSLRQQIELMAPTNARALIYGESGSGKELVAHAIHAMSPRANGRFVEVNCAAIPEDRIESELFGHVRGSLAGADQDSVGKFELAHGGTLFLDEVGDMSLKTQSKVLRAIEEQRFEPVGSGRQIQVDARVIASTNKRIDDEIVNGNFREDLFYRLNVVPLHIPPLRQHAEDIPVLAHHFLDRFAKAYGRKPKRLRPSAIDSLRARRWPGNVRELRNLMERMAILHGGEAVGAEHLPIDGRTPQASAASQPAFASLKEARNHYEREYVTRTLGAMGGNVTRAARALGMDRSNLHRKMRALGIQAEATSH